MISRETKNVPGIASPHTPRARLGRVRPGKEPVFLGKHRLPLSGAQQGLQVALLDSLSHLRFRISPASCSCRRHEPTLISSKLLLVNGQTLKGPFLNQDFLRYQMQMCSNERSKVALTSVVQWLPASGRNALTHAGNSMYLTSATLDDLLRQVLERLVRSPNRINGTRGTLHELTGVLLRLRNPRARLSHTEQRGKIFSGLGELLWYLAKSDKLRFISYYLPRYKDESEDNRTIYGAYGPRLFSMRGQDQIQNVVNLLKHKPESKRAVIQVFDAGDISAVRKEIPCTCTLQFMIRRGQLDMFTTMRSNDALIGLPHDIFAFTMMQEIVGRTLGCEIGTYRHFTASLHLYNAQLEEARQYLQEGWQATSNVAMPPMPREDPWPAIDWLLRAESAIRRGRPLDLRKLSLSPYWADLVRLLRVYRCSRDGDGVGISRIRRNMSSPVYDAFIGKREAATLRTTGQLTLEFPDETRT